MKRIILCITAFVLALSIASAQPQPTFKGGRYALDNFIQSKIVYPAYSSENCISGMVQVAFRLDSSGRVTNVKVQKGMGIDLDAEAKRVVKLTSGKWTIPAGYDHSSNIVLPVTFTADLSKCTGATGADIQNAIAAYQRRQSLEDAVVTYYKNKREGKADANAEKQVQGLKDQLGFDDDYIDDVLSRAKKKLKQGDTEGACDDWTFIRNIGSTRADVFLLKYCDK
ncbi:hypothetical protein GCM10023149_34440 [Mucilaginibacter gynuensis]|uniref:TonB C-terminal domain-containing protein n=1 Tax=Mucilaginibacter gynuensis TaxID=1302236 RepID=A0ABP8GUJ1_9SPHI